VFIPEMPKNDIVMPIIILFSILIALGIIVLFMSFLATLFKGAKYYTKHPVPLSNFKVDMYKKFYVLTYNDESWVMDIKDQRPLLGTSIKMINTYDRKRNMIDAEPDINFKRMEY
jgi:hypothetical protein